MTLNANILRGNMHEMPELDNPGFSGVYRVNSKTGEVSIVETEMQQPNGIGITPDNKLIGKGLKLIRLLFFTKKTRRDHSILFEQIFTCDFAFNVRKFFNMLVRFGLFFS